MMKHLISDFLENTSNINIFKHTKSAFGSDFRKLWTPHFGSCVSHSMASSIFILKNDFILIKKNNLESPLIFVLFLKG